MRLNLMVNGVPLAFEVAPDEKLADTLRVNHHHEVKKGCEAGTCGACTVLVDGSPRLACLLFSASLEGAQVVTAAGVPEDLPRALVEAGAVQCGFCTPGTVVSAQALLERAANPAEEEIRRALDGNLCRCTGYVAIVAGVKLAAARRQHGA
jgi:aerobic-type carbon monoxide dehydrogenase small subunit (CoxS/CutS family)